MTARSSSSTVLVGILLSLLFTACGRTSPENSGSGNLLRVESEPAGVNCPQGGLVVLTGLDQDEDGLLDDREVVSTNYVCNGQGQDGQDGQNGQDGHSTLVSTDEEAPGENCLEGGFVVLSGLDLDDDGILDPEEVTATEYLCNGQAGQDGQNGQDGQDGHSTLIDAADEPPGANCPAGGILISTGLDLDDNGVLEPEEVTATEYVCNGEDGADGQDGLGSLVSVMAEAAGANCTEGGQAVRSGVDSNRDGLLQPEEVTATDYVCNGATGADGEPGLTSLVRQEDAAPGDCPFEGRVVMTGLDEDRDGYLDDAEVQATSYVCNGEPGAPAHASLFRLLQEPAGANCPAGGTQVQTGLDTNDDGLLEPGEVTQARYLCNGVDGTDGLDSLVAVSDEAAGGACGVVAGKKVETGLDDDGDGLLDPAEVDTTSFVCNGEDGAQGINALVAVTAEPAGANCPSGGILIETGMDTSNDGVLGPGEVMSTSYICNGRNLLTRMRQAEWGGVCLRGGVKAESGVDDDADGVLGDSEVDQTLYLCNLFLVQIQVGYNHTCALVSDGTARCWGSNEYGQLGDGTRTDHWTPMEVSGLTQVVGLTTGGVNNCALLTDGTARCWGYNGFGQLGDGTTNDGLVPVVVAGLTDVQEISISDGHTCALLVDGTVRCWGYNYAGQLGDGTNTNRFSPVVVSGLSQVVGISLGSGHSCAVLTDGTARCWGRNGYGELGDGTTLMRYTPVVVSGLDLVARISIGQDHTCAMLTDGTARCWGYNFFGQLGDGTTTNSLTPVAVSGLTEVAGISTGAGFYTCAYLTDGTARCWGRNSSGQLGDGTGTNRLLPEVVKFLGGVAGIAADGYHTCAVLTDGTARCWGNNSFGQLGDGTTIMRRVPTFVVWGFAP